MLVLRPAQRCLAPLSLLAALLLNLPFAAAEGSREFDTGDTVTGGNADDQEVNVATQLYVDVLNVGGTEKICWRGNGDLTVFLPNGTQLVTLTSSNGSGCTGALATTGAYRVQLENSQVSGTRWDIRVCASTASNSDCRSTTLTGFERRGRLWSTEWSFQSNTSFAANRSNNGSVFAVVPGGDVGRDAVIEMQMRGVSGAFYRLFANNIGPQTSPGNVRVGRSVPKANHTVAPLYRLYLNPPEGASYNWLTPVVSSVVLQSDCGSGIVLDTAEGSVTFNSNVTGQYVLVCDVDEDGIYDFASDDDFSSFGDAAMGANTVLWNGRTNGGANAAAGDYNCVIRLNVGEFHYMADDIETSHPGIRMFRVEADKTTKTAIPMYWDDTAIPNDAEAMNNVAGRLSPSSPLATGLDPGSYATASSPFYYVGGDTSSPTGNARAWGNFDGDGKGNETYLDTFAAAATMQSPPFVVSVITAAGDEDNDGLDNDDECAIGTDPEDEDTDGDGREDGDDDDPLIPLVCADSDNDGCDDCALGMGSNPANDGPDTNNDGQCDNGDPDGDTVPNIDDVAPNDPSRCRDIDADGCDDCSASAGPNVGNDGPDKDADTLCDIGDVDSDNDGISDIVELGGTDYSLDVDSDGIPDYRDASRVTCTDVAAPIGQCDTLPASLDADGDQIPNHLDRDSDNDGISDAFEAGGTDANGDGMPDGCMPVTAAGACGSGLVASPPNTDAPSDALPNYLDTDSDGDGVSDLDEAFDSDGNGTTNVARSNADADADGIDNAFDPDCIPASNCGGTLGRPLTTPLAAYRDQNGDGTPDWLQVCGDAYLAAGQACDDGNSVNTDACSNSCLRGTSVSCTGDAQCDSMICDAGLGSCQACENDQASGTDSGCAPGAPTCRTVLGVNSCVTCADTALGTATDDGCSGAAPMCNPLANGGLGQCFGCLIDANCDDGNSCTTDSCDAGTCDFAPRSAGTSCTGGVCDGTPAAMCVACADTAGVAGTDAGCNAATPACDTSGAAPVCVACLADGDCASGVCGASNTCITCEDDQAGAAADHGCGGATPLCNAAANAGAGACVSCFDDQAGDATDVGCGGATPVCNPATNTCATCLDAAGDDDIGCSGASAMCNTAGNGGLGACAACLNAGHCGDGNTCTSDACNAGSCDNDPVPAGTACAGGVCDGTASAECEVCLDNAGPGLTDFGCGGATPACDTSGATPVCVACVDDGDCTSGVCGASNTCVTCEDDQVGAAADHGCGGATALCDATANAGAGACVSCFDDQAGDATDVGCGGATPVCNAGTNTCATCLDAAGSDDIGCSGASAMCNTAGNGGLGACAECLTDGHCDDANACTSDACDAGSCDNDPVAAGTACAGGVCDGTAAAECEVCLDNVGPGLTDFGCGGATPACDTSGATPACVACVDDGDCTTGVCGASNTCVTCEDDQVGAAADHGCGGATALCDATANAGAGACVSCFDDQAGDATDVGCGGATPVCNGATNTCATCLDAAGDDDIGCGGASAMCNTTGNGGLGACAECLTDGHCDDANACTSDSCSAGACASDPEPEGTACSGGVCDGTATAECTVCLDDAAPDAVDSGCSSGTPLCDLSGATPACVECLGLSDCPLGMYCDASNECIAGCGDDDDCAGFPMTPLCDVADSVCVECLQSADCDGLEICDADSECDSPDTDGDGIPDYEDVDDDNDGATDADELGGDDLSVDSDSDGVPDYLDADDVTCDDAAPADGVCDALPEALDADSDGVPNHLDRDSDGDGLTDARELGGTDDDGDGIPDDCEPVDSDGSCQGAATVEPANSDTDPTADFLDLDSDGDGIDDHDEAFDTDYDGSSNLAASGTDGNGDGIDDAFDPACAGPGDCGGVVGQPVLGALTANQDADGDGTPNWLQICGDRYATSGEACDDGNGVEGDACSNACLRGLGESCGDDAQCGSTLCDTVLGTCQGCVNDQAAGVDAGCDGGAPTCTTVSGENECVVCRDSAAGTSADDGCTGSTPVCDVAASAGLGACVECLDPTHCSDGNECTSDQCTAGACNNPPLAAGEACASGVCDGAAGAACVACVDDGANATTDSGCSANAPACDTSGAAPVCVECVADADCSAGVCADNACVACADDVAGAGQDRGCSSAQPFCTDDGGTASCVECLASDDCAGGYCNTTGACVPGCMVSSDCADEAGTPHCDGDSGECVACLNDGHCPGDMLCTADATCAFEDHDNDGLPDDEDTDDDGDGIPDADELGGEDHSGDDDGDGIPDYADPDAVECAVTVDADRCDRVPAALDADGDGEPNHLDIDADGDGIPDAIEGHDEDFDGAADREPTGADSDGDGLDDAFDGDCEEAGDCSGVIGVVAPLPDADDDGDPNFLDADDDGDRRSTRDERDDAEDYDGPADDAADVDDDSVLNWYDADSDGDRSLDVTENMAGGDANDDGLLDYLDPLFRALDTDGDGLLDVVECPAPAHPESNDCPDSDGDGRPDYDDTDDDGDGLPTRLELTTPHGMDVDSDGTPNYLDTDDDGDSVPTRDELGEGGTALDTDGDGRSNPYDTDDDGDGIPTERELGEDGEPMDTDGDGRDNHLDTDDDDDTIPTEDEIEDDGSFIDTDGDGTPNHLDPDDDGDDIATRDEPGDDNDNGVPDYLEPFVPPSGGTLAGGALCAVSDAGRSHSSPTGLLLAGFGLLLVLRLRSRKKKLLHSAASAALLLALCALVTSRASAQVAVDQFKPAPLASDGFALSRPDVLQPGSWGLQLMLDYANDPLVFELIPDDEDSEVRVIEHHLVLHAGAAIGLWDRLTVFGLLPVHLVMSGDEDPAVLAPPADGAGLGDLAFGGRFLLLGTGRSTGALAIEFIARVPTGKLASSDQAYSGDAIGSYEPALVGELRAGAFDVRLRAGARLREPRTVGNLKLDHELLYGVGARYRLVDALYAHAEVYGSTFLDSAFAREQSPLEALLGAKYQPSDFHFGLAAGPGILRGYGSPDVRVVLNIGYAPVEKHEQPVDTDRDGLYDPVDACPRDPEDKDDFEDQDGCPDPDNDRDGIVDLRDQCANDPEDTDDFEDEDGCPDPDNDRDGIVDTQDQCVNEPEDTDDFEDADGCPDPDNDRDGLIDPEDSCPNEPEDLDGFEDQDGCPEEGSGKVKVTCEKIDLQDNVYFDTGSDRIQERSFALLDQVAEVLRAAKHIKRMSVEGHTDSRGNDKKNLDLSKRRAASVVRYLVEKGIDASRLQSEGYGESKPIMDNKTEAGRSKNRRVEFLILEQDSSCTK